MKIRSLLLFTILFSLIVVPCSLRGQNILPKKTLEAPAPSQADSVALTPFPVTGITEAFSATGNLINESGKHHLTGKAVETFASQVDSLVNEINAFLGDSSTMSLQRTSGRILEQVSTRSRVYMGRLDALQTRFSAVAQDLESTSAVLLRNRTRWQLTLDSQTGEEAVESRTARIQRTLFKIDSVKSMLQEDLALVLATQDQLADKKLELETVVQRVKDQKVVVGENLLTIDMPGFFKDLSTLGDSAMFSIHAEKFKASVKSDYQMMKSGYKKSLITAAVFLVLLMVFAIWFKYNYERLISQEDFQLSEMHLTIIHSPVVSTLFVITLMVRLVLTDLPQTFFFLNIIILMFPLAILLIRMFGNTITRWIILLMVIYALAFIYELGYHPGILVRILLMVICFGGIWLFTRVYRQKPFFDGFNNKTIRNVFRGMMLAFASLHVIAVIANLVGAFQLAEFLTVLPVQVTLLAIGIQLASKMADTIVYLALSSNYLQKVNVIREDMQVIYKKAVWMVDLFLWLFALSVILQILLVKDLLFDWGRGVLTESKNIWNIDFTLANILIF
ncbi:MAG: hypothetical protein E4H10_10610, partial [Bacteroidia bacterium]